RSFLTALNFIPFIRDMTFPSTANSSANKLNAYDALSPANVSVCLTNRSPAPGSAVTVEPGWPMTPKGFLQLPGIRRGIFSRLAPVPPLWPDAEDISTGRFRRLKRRYHDFVGVTDHFIIIKDKNVRYYVTFCTTSLHHDGHTFTLRPYTGYGTGLYHRHAAESCAFRDKLGYLHNPG